MKMAGEVLLDAEEPGLGPFRLLRALGDELRVAGRLWAFLEVSLGAVFFERHWSAHSAHEPADRLHERKHDGGGHEQDERDLAEILLQRHADEEPGRRPREHVAERV